MKDSNYKYIETTFALSFLGTACAQFALAKKVAGGCA